MSGNKVCYVCCVWLGERRCSTNAYDDDHLAYVKEQVRHLEDLEHNLDKIVFVVNLEEDQRLLFEEAKKCIPDKIKEAEVEVVERRNVGLSYGAWSDTFGRYKFDYDYYIFTEDDYYFNINNFDSYLVNKFENTPNVGYLCMMTIHPTPEHPEDLVHAGNSIGLSSAKILNEVWEKHGFLPHESSLLKNSYEGQDAGQVGQSHAIYQLGYDIIDVREDYITAHDMGPSKKAFIPEFDHFVEMYFHWNQEHIVIPAVMRFHESFFFINIIDDQFKTDKQKMKDKLENFDWGVMNNHSLKDLLIKELFEDRIYNRLFEVNEGDVVVDVGASVGPFVYSIADKKPSQIYTFEPSKTEFPALVKNTRGLPICHINKAIWEGDGLTNQMDVYYSEGLIETMKFKTFRELYAIEKIDFLKTDCEGGEYFIFNEENIDFLVENVGVIVGEWHLETPERKEMFRKFRDVYLPRFKETRVFAVGSMDPNERAPEITWDLHNEHFLQYYRQVIVHIDNRK